MRAVTGNCDDGIQAVNLSGNLNVKPSVDPIAENEGYSAVLYDNKSGLPTSEANAIAQTREGFIWIGTYSGLIRYDGNSFERIESIEGIRNVRCLFVDGQNRLWIGTNDSGVFLLQNGKHQKWDKENGLGADSIRCITQDDRGITYVATIAGIAMIGTDMQAAVLEDEQIKGSTITEVRCGSDGIVYGISITGDLFALRDGKLLSYRERDEYPFEGANCILPDPERPGQLYVGTEHYVCRGSLEQEFNDWKVWKVSSLLTVQCLEYIDGRIWICARTGIGKMEYGKIRILEKIPMDNSFYHIMTDKDGNLWMVSGRQGIMKIVPNRFTDLYDRYGLTAEVVNSTCMADGQLFVGTENGLVVFKNGEELENLPIRKAVTASGRNIKASDLLEYLDGIRIRSIIRDSKNRIWICTARVHGLIRYDNGVITEFTEDDGLTSETVRVVSECRDGSMLAATNNGINVIEGDRVVRSYGQEEGLDVRLILTITEGYGHELIAGSDGGGIYVIKEDGISQIGTEEGLTSGIIMRIRKSRTGDFYWIITGNSLARMTSDYRVTTVREFPFANNSDLYENSNGDLWILGSTGVCMISSEQLQAEEADEPLYFGIPNGLPYMPTANSYSALTEDGNLYISGTEGVIKVNIDASFENTDDLRIVIPFLEADGERYYRNEDGQFFLPADAHKVTIFPYVLDYSLNDPLLSYRLEGVDRESVIVKRSELGPVTYTHLPGGIYRFIVELHDTNGVRSSTMSVSIDKQKAIYEQVWFMIILAAAAALILFTLFWMYFQRKMRIMEEKHREETERERIANELSLAARIQADMLPNDFPAFPERSEFDIYASMDPAKEVGGDFYDFFLTDDDHLCMVMADVSGKGVPAALFMMASRIILANNAMMHKPPAQILTDTNTAICDHNEQEMFVTVWLGILEISTGKLTAANAGHEYPVLKKPDGQFELIKDKHGLVIGGMEGVKYREYELRISPGTKLFLYTDGVPEATDAGNTLFGTERMLAALNKNPDAEPEQILKSVRADVDSFVKEAEQFDDITMLCIEYKGPDQQGLSVSRSS